MSLKHGDRWGDWVLNLEPANNPSLDYRGQWYRHHAYEIPLQELRSRLGLKRWVDHLNEKDWGRAAMVDFMRAVEVVNEVNKQCDGTRAPWWCRLPAGHEGLHNSQIIDDSWGEDGLRWSDEESDGARLV